MENLEPRKPIKKTINYDNDEELEWMDYLNQNLSHDSAGSSPFPSSSWSYKETTKNNLDQSIKDAVTLALYKTQEVDASEILVDVVNGKVSLIGFVKTEDEKKKAQEVIKNITGVWQIIDNLEVK